MKKIITTYIRGWKAWFDKDSNSWKFIDNGKTIDLNRPCKKCGQSPTKEGHDACLGVLHGVKFACCGHGIDNGYLIQDNNNE